MRIAASFKLIVAMLVASVLLSGCGWFGGLLAKDDPNKMAVEQLYRRAKDALDNKNYAESIRLYERLEARFPYGVQSQQAILDSAYAQYKLGERAQAVAAADRFIKLYPNHDAVDYAWYLKGLANFIEDLGLMSFISTQDLAERDQQAARESYEAFDNLVAKFPDSRYAADARQRMRYLVNALSRNEAYIAAYYYNRGAYQAAINRAQRCLTDFPNTPSNEQALAILVKSHRAMGNEQLATDAERVFKGTYPGVALEKRSAWWKFWE